MLSETVSPDGLHPQVCPRMPRGVQSLSFLGSNRHPSPVMLPQSVGGVRAGSPADDAGISVPLTREPPLHLESILIAWDSNHALIVFK